MNTVNNHTGISYRVILAIFLVWLFHVSAVAGIIITGETTWFIPKTPLNLFACFLLLVWVYPISRPKEILTFLSFFLAGMTAEIIGVQTGILFGDYSYGDNLGWKILGVPVTIGINWALLTFITGTMAGRWLPGLWSRVITGVGLMLLLDLLLEGVAPGFDFWEFQGGVAPLYNYICWGILALVMQFSFHYLKIKGNFAYSWNLYLVQFLFFLVFYLGLL